MVRPLRSPPLCALCLLRALRAPERSIYQGRAEGAGEVKANIYVGNDVTDLEAEGNVIVNGGKLTIQGNHRVFIKNGFKVHLGAQLKIN